MAKEYLAVTKSFGAKDKFNMMSAKGLDKVENGDIISVTGVAITKEFDEKENKEMICAYVKTIDGMFNTISETAVKAMSELIAFEPSEENVAEIRVDKRTSGNNREYITLYLV